MASLLADWAKAFNPFTSLATALLAGAFAIIAIVFKERYETKSKKIRFDGVLKAELKDIEEHFERNEKRLQAMISCLRDTRELWPERLHIEKLQWPEDTAFFNTEISGYMSIDVANNMAKFRLRIRNINIDANAALRIYDNKNRDELRSVLDYVRLRTLRIKDLAPFALKDRQDFIPIVQDISPDYYKSVKDMIFFSRKIIPSDAKNDPLAQV